jgi:hypothetical protein
VPSSVQFHRTHLHQVNPAPSVLAQRNKEYQVARFLTLSYLLAVVGMVSAFGSLLYGGTLLTLWEGLLRLHPGPETWAGLVLLGSLPTVFVATQVHQVFNEFWSIRSFRHLYRTCRYIDPIQLMQSRLSYVIAAHPDRFSYAFSGRGIVVEVRRKGELARTASALSAEAEEILFLDHADEGQRRSAPHALELLEHPPLLTAPEEPDAISSFDAGRETTMPALPELQKDEMPLQSQESSEVMERETPSDEQQTGVVPGAIEESLDVIVSLRETVTLFLTEKHEQASKHERSKKGIAVPIGNVTHLALIAYLAQNREKWVDVELVMDRVYEHIEEKTKVQALFNQHISRIRKKVRERIGSGFPQWASAAETFDLFEQQMKTGFHSCWRLSKNCIVPEMDALQSFYHEMDMLAASRKTRVTRNPVQEKKLLSEAKRLINDYSGNYLKKYPEDEEGYVGGYLIEYHYELSFRGWVLAFFNECRQKYIFCLERVAELEHLLWQEIKQPESLSNAVRLYKECAYAASCAPVDSSLGEHALREGLRLYQEAGELEEAEALYQTYRRRILRAQSEWLPEKETKDLLHAIGLDEDEAEHRISILCFSMTFSSSSVMVSLLSLHVPSFDKASFSCLVSEDTHQGKYAGTLLCVQAS